MLSSIPGLGNLPGPLGNIAGGLAAKAGPLAGKLGGFSKNNITVVKFKESNKEVTDGNDPTKFDDSGLDNIIEANRDDSK
jgi:hypothetical protein